MPFLSDIARRAKLRYFLRTGRDSDEVFRYCFGITAKSFQRPLPRGLRVRGRLSPCDSLRHKAFLLVF